MSNDPPVTALVTLAANGDQWAWDALVERYAPLIWSICRRYELGGADAGDVGQTVWLQLVEHLGEIRDPTALPGWLATTTRRECCRIRRAARGPQDARHVLDTESIPDAQAPTAEQQLITLLISDPPLSYAQISAQLGIPVGSIGPRRARCLDKLRRDPAIAALLDPDAASIENRAAQASSDTTMRISRQPLTDTFYRR